MKGDVLSLRALGRATLDRQFLLRRRKTPALAAVEHLVGMQAQIPMNPYVGLWSRLDGFRPDEVSGLLLDRSLVRIVVMRGTIHLVTAADCLLLRPLAQPVLDRELARHRDFAPVLRGVDLKPVLAFARRLLADRPLNGTALRAALAKRFPKRDSAALAYACRCLLALVQVPPRGVWGSTAQVTSTTAESWLGRPLEAKPSIDDVVLRYFAAFGPASVADVAAWSRLTGMREVVERLERRLREFRDESGRELFDLPEAPRPDPDTPGPARFLPEYDNVLLSHADRSRFISDSDRKRLSIGPAPVRGSVVYDGTAFGTWRIDRERPGGIELEVVHIGRLTRKAKTEISVEGEHLLRFVELDADRYDVRFVAIT